ncbi:MAG: hypothetical protein JOZ18_10580 [Chloroflexi bacterium]|nr:hypothetical protein [Chloroflexota bacterium]
MQSDVPGSLAHKSSSNVDDEPLRQVKPYIDALARKMAGTVFSDADVDDLAQNSWIKFWLVSLEQEIRHPRTYIWRIVRSEFVTMLRRRKMHIPLTTTEDGEIEYIQGNVMVEVSEGMANPELEFEQRAAVEMRMEEVVEAMGILPARQRTAVACRLWERLDNLIPFVDALSAHELDVDVLWPDDRVDKQRLQASYAPARFRMAQHMHIDMNEYERLRDA